MLLIYQVFKSDPKIIILLLLPRFSLNLRYNFKFWQKRIIWQTFFFPFHLTESRNEHFVGEKYSPHLVWLFPFTSEDNEGGILFMLRRKSLNIFSVLNFSNGIDLQEITIFSKIRYWYIYIYKSHQPPKRAKQAVKETL